MSPTPIGDGRGDPGGAATAVMREAEALLFEVHQARTRLAAAPESPERVAYLATLESFERGLPRRLTAWRTS